MNGGGIGLPSSIRNFTRQQMPARLFCRFFAGTVEFRSEIQYL